MGKKLHDINSDSKAWKTGDIITVLGVPKYYVCDVMPVLGPVLKGLTKQIQEESIKRTFLG
jgi:hypothetical protein